MSFKKLCFWAFCLSLTFLAVFLVLGGCGDEGDGTFEVDLTATVTLPSASSSSYSSVVKADSQFTDVSAAGLKVSFFDEDTYLGKCTTDETGQCTLEGAILEEGKIFTIAKDSDGNEKLGAIWDASAVDAATTSLSHTMDTLEDLAYRSWLASCEEKLGEECVLGSNAVQGTEQLEPVCVWGAITNMPADAADDTVGGMFGALLEAHKSHVAGGGDPDTIKDALKGDPSAQAQFAAGVGDVTAAEGDTIPTSDAAVTAADVNDLVRDALCEDTEKDATFWQTAPVLLANLISSIDPDDVESIIPITMNEIIVNLMNMEDEGMEGIVSYFEEENNARAMMEAVIGGGFDLTDNEDSTDEAALTKNENLTSDGALNELKKRIAVFYGDSSTETISEAVDRGVAALEVFKGTHFSDFTTPEEVRQYISPLLLDLDRRVAIRDGGWRAFDNIFDQFEGGLEEFKENFDSLGWRAFREAYPQVGPGEACTSTYECIPPSYCDGGICSDDGCNGDTCSLDSDCCPTSGGFCDRRDGVCRYNPERITDVSPGSPGGACQRGGVCTGSGLTCVQGICRISGGSPSPSPSPPPSPPPLCSSMSDDFSRPETVAPGGCWQLSNIQCAAVLVSDGKLTIDANTEACGGSTQFRMRKIFSASNVTTTVKFSSWANLNGAGDQFGIMVNNSDPSTGLGQIKLVKIPGGTACSASAAPPAVPTTTGVGHECNKGVTYNGEFYLRVVKAGANVTLQSSSDGITFTDILALENTITDSPYQVAIFMKTGNVDGDLITVIENFEVQ